MNRLTAHPYSASQKSGSHLQPPSSLHPVPYQPPELDPECLLCRAHLSTCTINTILGQARCHLSPLSQCPRFLDYCAKSSHGDHRDLIKCVCPLIALLKDLQNLLVALMIRIRIPPVVFTARHSVPYSPCLCPFPFSPLAPQASCFLYSSLSGLLFSLLNV